MTLWAAAAALALLAGLWLARSFWARAAIEPNEADQAISIYRDQLEEVRRDARRGLISAAERDAAEQEIEGRTLRAARRLEPGVLVARRTPAAALAALVLVTGSSLGLYAWLGTPEAEDQPLAARRAAILERQAEAGDPQSRALMRAERARENPESFEDWWLLARAYAATGDHASAADAYRQAAALSDDDPAVLSAYAEALTLANGNKVPAAAKLIFAQIRARSADPRARYYLALARAQAQDFQGALEDWLGLLGDSTADAPWTALVRRDVVNMVRFLDLDLLSVLPDASEAELAKAATPVGGAADPAPGAGALAARLAQDPKDWQGWIALARLRADQGDAAAAAAAIAAGRRHYAAAPFVLGKLTEAARALGLEPKETGPGPSAAELAAAETSAAEMSAAEQEAMIRGMVDGLAARLAAEPDDLEGWLMLIRSYAVLQEPAAARDAVRNARRAFRGAPGELRRIAKLADSLGVPQE